MDREGSWLDKNGAGERRKEKGEIDRNEIWIGRAKNRMQG